MTDLQHYAYLAWDAPTRWFHWINALAVNRHRVGPPVRTLVCTTLVFRHSLS